MKSRSRKEEYMREKSSDHLREYWRGRNFERREVVEIGRIRRSSRKGNIYERQSAVVTR